MNAKDRLRKRLEMYWKFELLNVGLVPALMFFSAFAYEYALGWGSYAAMMPMCGLLYIGGIYWRAKCRALDEGAAPIRRVMPFISKAQIPLLLLSLIAIAIAILLWVKPNLSASRGDQWQRPSRRFWRGWNISIIIIGNYSILTIGRISNGS